MTETGKIVKSDWEPTANRFVAFFDIMGFKDMVSRKSHEEVLETLKSLSKSRSQLDNLNYYQFSSETRIGETMSFTFSDSIIIFSKKDSIDDLNKIIMDCSYILEQSISDKIPIKGAISYGKTTIDKEMSLFFGQPIIDSFYLHENLCLYGVIADHSFQQRLEELNIKDISRSFTFYKTPMKYGFAHHYLMTPSKTYKNLIIEDLKKLYLTVSGKPRQYIDNTIDYINSLDTAENK